MLRHANKGCALLFHKDKEGMFGDFWVRNAIIRVDLQVRCSSTSIQFQRFLVCLDLPLLFFVQLVCE